jgi:hypothetical protein
MQSTRSLQPSNHGVFRAAFLYAALVNLLGDRLGDGLFEHTRLHLWVHLLSEHPSSYLATTRLPCVWQLIEACATTLGAASRTRGNLTALLLSPALSPLVNSLFMLPVPFP